MKKYLPALMSAALVYGFVLNTQYAMAQTAPPVSQKTVKKTATKKPAPQVLDDDEKEPDTGGTSVTEFHCELGNKLTIYKNADDDKYIALRWRTRLLRMERVGTTTGANRFENRKIGLIWIGIPAKSMLLDSKKGQQLANECKSAEQLMPSAPAPTGMPDAASKS
jgi:hypothetical protein